VLGDTRWGAIFSELDPDSVREAEAVVGLAYAEFDGHRWSTLQEVPRPAGGKLLVTSSSRLVRAGDRLAWAVVEDAPARSPQLVYYEHTEAGWQMRAPPAALADVAALTYTEGTGLLLALFGEDPDLPGWQQSLRVYRRGASWELVSRVTVAERGTKVLYPGIAMHGPSMSVGWIALGPEGSTARARVGIAPGRDGTDVVLDESADQLVTLQSGPEPEWIVGHRNLLTGSRELRFLRVDSAGSVERIASVPNPYTGFFSALATGVGEALVVGPEFDPDPARPTVRSLIVRLSDTCD
jgi:hypothetical protein